MRRFLALFCCLLWIPNLLLAQELNCKIQINTDQIGGTDKAVYEGFKNVLSEWMNNRQWTNLSLGRNEKIECSFLFIFQKTEGNTHEVEMQVQSTRPVYGSNYTTALINARQGLKFDYQEGEILDFNPNTVDNNLTATMAFWAYIILGMDFDSFSPLGGTAFIQRAKDIVTLAQGFLGDTWKAHEDDRNCWAWSDALTDESQKSIRLLSYQYHRLGLDVMQQDPAAGRAVITESFKCLEEIKRSKPQSPLLSNLADSKLDELVQLYTKAEQTEKQKVYDMLVFIYPAQSSRLEDIKNLD